MLKNTLCLLYLRKGEMDFNYIYSDKLFGDGKELISFW